MYNNNQGGYGGMPQNYQQGMNMNMGGGYNMQSYPQGNNYNYQQQNPQSKI